MVNFSCYIVNFSIPIAKYDITISKFCRYILSNNNDEYPSLSSIPPILISFFISPTCQIDSSDKSKLESEYQITTQYCQNTSSQEKLLRLFALSCKSGHQNLAFEVCHRMNKTFLELAITYADNMKLFELCEKINSSLKIDHSSIIKGSILL